MPITYNLSFKSMNKIIEAKITKGIDYSSCFIELNRSINFGILEWLSAFGLLKLYWIIWILCETIMGAFSFIFYGPTYLNILNIYSLCRIDDISWGTKGLESGSGGSSKLKDSWKLIKFVHVAKYVIWNMIVGPLLSFESSYTARFYITIILIGVMGS